MTNLVNHPGLWLAQPAADSLARLERDHGKIPVTSAGRTPAEQQALINRYDHPKGPQDRPPFLFNPARPAESSNHVKHGGIAIDTPSEAHMNQYGPAYGWFRNYAYDPVHYEYDAARDQHKNAAPSKPTTAPASTGRPTIRQGSVGQAVKDLQARLNKNYPAYSKLKVDGQFGGGTANVVKEFQRRSGLARDGVVGPATWKKLGF